VARLFHRLLAVVFVVAWASLGHQIVVLSGSRGLLPFAPIVEQARHRGLRGLLDAPTWFVLGASDLALSVVPWIGAALAIAAFFRLRPRLCLLLTTLLYLSFAPVLSGFWYPPDDLLVECGLLAALVREDAPSPLGHLLLRVLIFKLYIESGIAKWQSPLHDWIDGSAMTHYYQVLPVPAPLAWYLHKLPAAAHHLESWGVLVLELVVPFAVFGGRRLRLGAAIVFSSFQLLNILTGNFGHFAYLSLVLNVLLLDDRDVARARAWLARTLRVPSAPPPLAVAAPLAPDLDARAAKRNPRWGGLVVAGYVGLSALVAFGGRLGVGRLLEGMHALSAYRMFDYVRRERVDPELQTFDGASWTAQPLRFLPGDPARAPGFVAPYLPRVDVGLGFYQPHRRLPPPASVLLSRLCHDPAAVQPLFALPLPASPLAARIALVQIRFTTADERRQTGATWQREPAGVGEEIDCAITPSSPDPKAEGR
jgi:uncharacterized membrane protein YphA (DoxX/SURF4 family)